MTLIKIYWRFEKYNVEVIIYGVTQIFEVKVMPLCSKQNNLTGSPAP